MVFRAAGGPTTSGLQKRGILKCESAKVNVIADRGDAIRRSALSLSHLGETAIGPKLLGSAKGETTYHSSMGGPCFAPGLRKISEILYKLTPFLRIPVFPPVGEC